ncbi:MAG: phosphonate metabolism transcriptional regulator PhnF [Alphaproteobacteria bacterium]|nr:phosphonate metabolism transcriptional regulator PhnF [Alphaproteobacteria bacterium]
MTVRIRQAQEASPGITLWRRIADELAQDIARGGYAGGEKLPGEVDMARRFGVNRHTVRRALAELNGRGLVRAERGSGTYVDARLAYPITARTRFSEIVGRAGHAPDGVLIAHRCEAAPPAIAGRLGLDPGAAVIALEILRSADGRPVSLATSHLPQALMPEAAKVFAAERSMTRTLAHFGVDDYRRRRTSVTAALADAVEARHLDVAPGRPLLIVESLDVAGDGRPVVTTRARFSADRVEIVIDN